MRHIVISPDPKGSVDFTRADLDSSGVWFQRPENLWLPLLTPKFIAAASRGADVTFSSFRHFGFNDPRHFTLPEGNFSLKAFCRLGKLFGRGMWGCLTWYDVHRPPVASGDRFIVDDEGLAKQLNAFFKPEFYDSLRDISRRPRIEVWVRWGWTADEIAPGCYDLPDYVTKYGDPSDPLTAMRQAAARAAPAPGSYERTRLRERAQRDAAAARAAEDEKATEGAGSPQVNVVDHSGILVFSGEDPDVRNLEAADASTGSVVAAADAAHAMVPPMLSHEQQTAARKLREKQRRGTRSQVAATAANKKSAKEWSTRQVQKLERSGKL
jgi:hypothetical protein